MKVKCPTEETPWECLVSYKHRKDVLWNVSVLRSNKGELSVLLTNTKKTSYKRRVPPNPTPSPISDCAQLEWWSLGVWGFAGRQMMMSKWRYLVLAGPAALWTSWLVPVAADVFIAGVEAEMSGRLEAVAPTSADSLAWKDDPQDCRVSDMNPVT